ncbi:uncharacterized protein J4E87_002792 [Alternaria ethzedia]|uniref:uncharacterized protein n=1 Tax=Alternaria ethzedia TaxID=181014 RepID=UPI0020C32E3D|nr:uncharacterized protein J4E87_002792 [Alternaria ethzedia]KAI4629606.1 hypothetical protein J4E87_002792 [Alternaria ethzedia]
MFKIALFSMLYAYFEGLCKQYRETLSGFKLTRPFFKPSLAVPNEQSVPPIREKWYYPADIANDLKDFDLPQRIKEEVYACAWEYARCVIPQYTNWNRYVAFMRVIVIGIVAECKGDLVQVSLGDNLLGYNLTALLDELFQGTTEHAAMAREFRCFLLITADKASKRREGLLFKRYVTALAKSPRQWFRMRDTDALIRFTMGAALVCNDLDDVHYTEEQFEALDELGATLYDSVAFYKHRSEGETNSTFAYAPSDIRIKAFHQSLMRRYRFIEDGMMIGRPETTAVITQARQQFKLWNRVDMQDGDVKDVERYNHVVARSDELMFDGLREFLDASNENTCKGCQHRETHGGQTSFSFGGIKLCDGCKESWGAYVESFSARFADVFPEIKNVMTT